MVKNPRIKPVLTKADKTLEIIGWVAILAIWALTLVCYAGLPDIIPVHFNATDQPDRFGAKSTIWWLPLIATVLFVAITVLSRYPHISRYSVKITPDNAQRQYSSVVLMLRFLKLAIVVIFIIIVLKTVLYR